MTADTLDGSYSVGRGFGTWNVPSAGYDLGVVRLPEGVVECYMQGDDERAHFTQLTVTHNGRCYWRTIRHRYSRRGVVRKAREFLSEFTREIR